MDTKHTDEMREALETYTNRHEPEIPYLGWSSKRVGFIDGYQAATASAEAKYLPVIEKLVEALDYIRDDFVEYWYGESGKSADLKSIIDAEKALALAAPLLGRK